MEPDLKNRLTDAFTRAHPDLAASIAALVRAGEPKARIAAHIHAAIDRSKVPGDPQRGELTRSGAMLLLDHLSR